MPASVGIVIPAYRADPETVNNFTTLLHETIGGTVHVEFDAPTQETLDRLSEPDSINTCSGRRGKGRAITEGFEFLSTDILAFADADAATPAASVADVVESVRSRQTDLAIGSRRHPDANIEAHQTHLRRSMGDVFAWTARHLLPTSAYDYQCGAKGLTAEAWQQLRPHLYESGFAWDLELIAMAGAKGLRIEEIPVTWRDDPESTVDPFSAAVNMASALVSIRHRVKAMDGHPIHTTLDRVQRSSPSPLLGDD
ncbi:glycosyltransferase [Halorubrum xinjiangense]|uniref:glycosyltransferase n=1 Tax=Halorubrum xinjiangense TaxID=261291 RepID=UPI003C700515